jgi:hypothetical protein
VRSWIASKTVASLSNRLGESSLFFGFCSCVRCVCFGGKCFPEKLLFSREKSKEAKQNFKFEYKEKLLLLFFFSRA